MIIINNISYYLNMSYINIYKNINNLNILKFMVFIILFYMTSYVLLADYEGFNNMAYGEYPSSFNINKHKVLKNKNICRPIYNCRRVGFYCSAIN